MLYEHKNRGTIPAPGLISTRNGQVATSGCASLAEFLQPRHFYTKQEMGADHPDEHGLRSSPAAGGCAGTPPCLNSDLLGFYVCWFAVSVLSL